MVVTLLTKKIDSHLFLKYLLSCFKVIRTFMNTVILVAFIDQN